MAFSWVLPSSICSMVTLKTQVWKAMAPLITFFLPTYISHSCFLRVLTFMYFWAVGHSGDYFVDSSLFSQNAWLLLTVIVFHSFILLVSFLRLRVIFKSEPDLLMCWSPTVPPGFCWHCECSALLKIGLPVCNWKHVFSVSTGSGSPVLICCFSSFKLS